MLIIGECFSNLVDKMKPYADQYPSFLHSVEQALIIWNDEPYMQSVARYQVELLVAHETRFQRGLDPNYFNYYFWHFLKKDVLIRAFKCFIFNLYSKVLFLFKGSSSQSTGINM